MKKRLCRWIFFFCMVPFLQYCTSDMLWEWLHSPDFYYLEVIETVPANNESNVSINSEITVKLNDNVDPATLLPANFFLNNGVTALSITYNSVDKIITFVPDSALASSITYCATLTTDIKTLVGESLAEPYQWCFTTVSTSQPEIDVMVDAVSASNGYIYDFGLLQTGETRTVTIDVANSGTADLSIIGPVVFAPGGDPGFSINQGALNLTIPATQSSSFTVDFNPGSAGSYQTVVEIPNNDLSENPYTIYLTGDALASVQPEISVWQGTLLIPSVDGVFDFGTIPLGDTSQTLPFSITNTGSDDLSIDSIVLGDKNADEFNLTIPGMPVVLSPGGEVTFSISFSPVSLGTKKGSITITSNDPLNSIFIFRVKGRGY